MTIPYRHVIQVPYYAGGRPLDSVCMPISIIGDFPHRMGATGGYGPLATTVDVIGEMQVGSTVFYIMVKALVNPAFKAFLVSWDELEYIDFLI